MEKINIAELLKDCPKGMKLDCAIYDNVEFEGISDNKDWPIKISVEGYPEVLNPYGCISYRDYTKCVIFPKGKTTWEGFIPPCKFKDGDVLYVRTSNQWICIYKEGGEKENVCHRYVAATSLIFVQDDSPLCHRNNIKEIRLATEEEKQKLFKTIKDNGYKWNPETKTLKKIIQSKFKVGDKVRHKNNHNVVVTITNIEKDYYACGTNKAFWFTEQNDYELVPKKFDITTLKPFDKVLVRDNSSGRWDITFYELYDNTNSCYPHRTLGGNIYKYCIPYEGNEHLLGKVEDCKNFYKIWE